MLNRCKNMVLSLYNDKNFLEALFEEGVKL